MTKIALRDDPLGGGRVSGVWCQVLEDDVNGDGSGVPAGLEGDPPVQMTQPNHEMTIRVRVRSGYDDDGTPTFDWTTLVTGTTILMEERTEFDSEAGFTLVKAKATILYSGTAQVPETASVIRDDGVRYAVDSVSQVPGRISLDMHRVAAEPAPVTT